MAIFLVGYVSSIFVSGIGLPILVASMGASAILLFAVSSSPLSQPWALTGGNIFPALIAVTCGKLVPDLILAAAISVSLSLLVMQYLRCLHPPGGALALLPLLGDTSVHELGYRFVLQPVGLNILILLTLGFVINNLLPGRRYPARAVPVSNDVHKHEDPGSLDRVGINQSDLHNALKEMNTYLDVSEEDLSRVYKMAGMQAYRRKMGEISCADIMSRDLVTAEYGTELEEAWALLRYHKIKAIPVVDKAKRVIGIITLVDFLKRANLKTYETFQDKLMKFIKRTPGMDSEKPEVVGQIMAAPVYTAKETMHIVELVPLLSERGLHHIPIVDAERRLIGMVTQSDLIAALYAGSVSGE
ncbi:MAG TPA: HPP family protein [Gallionellaceae bacterium]|nr:HPP family protein [Gallionellaceae bacterium]HQS74108.1 HPP family protein [Gallionellaceae bacterium]